MTTVTEITETDPMRRQINKDLVAQYINADLVARASFDLRTSYIFYDEEKLFSNLMLSIMCNDSTLELLAEKTSIRYYSKGIV